MTDGELDLVIARGRIVDGCGNPWYYGDVGIHGDSIGLIAPAGTLRGRRKIDAAGCFVAPGFVDPHAHSEITLLARRTADSVVRQGVTTEVIGNCGLSAAPVDAARVDDLRNLWGQWEWGSSPVEWSWRTFAEYLGVLGEGGMSINVAPLVGHSTLRIAVMGFDSRAADGHELAAMKRLLAESMRAGAFGLSTGLVYPPGCHASTEEIVELASVASEFHGIYTTHVRGERETIVEAVTEAVDIGRRAGLPVEISHNAPKFGAPQNASANLAVIEEARRRAQDVTADNDVHTDVAVRLSRALPQPVLDLGWEALRALLLDVGCREQLKRDVEADRLPGAGYMGLVKHHAFDRIVILHAQRHSQLIGKSVAAIAAERSRDPFDTFFDLILEEEDRVVGIFDYIDCDDIVRMLRHPHTMVSSDGLVMDASCGQDLSAADSPPALNDPPDPSESRAPLYWPCSFGEYPGLLERFVREEPVLGLEEAIRKSTSFPAQRFGLLDRGVLRPGLRADLVVFDLDRVHDRATNLYPHRHPLENVPHQYPEGIDYVLVNGVLVVEAGEHASTLPGRVLRPKWVQDGTTGAAEVTLGAAEAAWNGPSEADVS